MPDITFSPATLTVSGVDSAFFNGASFTPAILAFSGTITAGASLSSGLTGSSVRLDRLTRDVSVVDQRGGPDLQFQSLWQRTVETIEGAFVDDQNQINSLNTIVAQLQQVINAQAATAAELTTVRADIDLANSRTEPVDGLLSATSTGTINISAHDRVYADGTTVAVSANSISGFTEGQFVRVYYDDAARAGGSVSYQGTTSEVTQTGSRHVVGGVSIPANGSPPTAGVGTTPPGYVRNLNENEALP